MDSALTSRLIMPKYSLKKIRNKRNISQTLLNKKTALLSTNSKTQEEELNTSWDFTPFPDLYFPSQKSQMIKNIKLKTRNEKYSAAIIFQTLNSDSNEIVSVVFKMQRKNIIGINLNTIETIL